jgi:hypothetical protein
VTHPYLRVHGSTSGQVWVEFVRQNMRFLATTLTQIRFPRGGRDWGDKPDRRLGFPIAPQTPNRPRGGCRGHLLCESVVTGSGQLHRYSIFFHGESSEACPNLLCVANKMAGTGLYQSEPAYDGVSNREYRYSAVIGRVRSSAMVIARV